MHRYPVSGFSDNRFDIAKFIRNIWVVSLAEKSILWYVVVLHKLLLWVVGSGKALVFYFFRQTKIWKRFFWKNLYFFVMFWHSNRNVVIGSGLALCVSYTHKIWVTSLQKLWRMLMLSLLMNKLSIKNSIQHLSLLLYINDPCYHLAFFVHQLFTFQPSPTWQEWFFEEWNSSFKRL